MQGCAKPGPTERGSGRAGWRGGLRQVVQGLEDLIQEFQLHVSMRKEQGSFRNRCYNSAMKVCIRRVAGGLTVSLIRPLIQNICLANIVNPEDSAKQRNKQNTIRA